MRLSAPVFFFNDAATTEIYTLSLHDALPISNNLGDSKSLVTHPATTTHMRIGAEERARLGIMDGTVRLSVGLEDVEDLIEDLSEALDGLPTGTRRRHRDGDTDGAGATPAARRAAK